MSDLHIVQIMPAIGWEAVYAHDKATDGEFGDPLVAWALIEDDGNMNKRTGKAIRYVVGLSGANNDPYGGITFSEDADNFKMYRLIREDM